MNLNLFRGGDAQTDLVPADFQHCNYHVMADHDALVHVPRQYQQSSLLPWAMVESLVARPEPWTIGAPVRSGTSYAVRGMRDGAPDAARGSSLPVRVPGRHKARITRAANKPASAVTNLPEREIPGHLRNGGSPRSPRPPMRINIHPCPGRRGRHREIRP